MHGYVVSLSFCCRLTTVVLEAVFKTIHRKRLKSVAKWEIAIKACSEDELIS